MEWCDGCTLTGIDICWDCMEKLRFSGSEIGEPKEVKDVDQSNILR